MKYDKYLPIEYTDVYSDGDSWIVNNLCKDDIIYVLSTNDEELLKILHHNLDFVNQYPLSDIIMENDGIMIEFFIKHNYYPIGRLEFIETVS